MEISFPKVTIQHEKLENKIHSNRGNILSMKITLEEERFDLSAYEQQQGPKWENALSRYLTGIFSFSTFTVFQSVL